MDPLVSIGMPVRGNASTILPAITSLLNQTYRHWELLLIDDGSPQPLGANLSDVHDDRIRIIRHQESRGLATRLNEAIALANGKFFARMDGDDICFPDRLERQVSFLKNRPDVDLLGTRVVVFNDEGSVVGTLPSSEEHDSICASPWRTFIALAHPTWMGKTEWFRRHRYDPVYQKSQDREILLRSYRSSRFACLPDYLLGYRQDHLSFNKILWTRLYVCRALCRQSLVQRDVRLLCGAGLQVAKLAWDSVALTSGLKYRLWKHRARPVPEDVEGQWRRVWGELSQPVSMDLKSAAA